MDALIGLFLGFLMGRKTCGLPGVPGGLPGSLPVPPGPGKSSFPWPTIPAGWFPPFGSPPGGSPPPPTGQERPPVPDGGGLPIPMPWTPPVAQKTHVIKTGDFPSGLAEKKTGDGGRWRELLTVNPEMSTYTDAKGQTQIKPWKPGQTILLPPGW